MTIKFSSYLEKARNDQLCDACFNGDFKTVKCLVEKGADINYDKDYCIKYTSLRGHLDIVKYLVEKGANIHSDNDKSLDWADRNTHYDVAKYLVSKMDPQYVIDKLPKFIKYLDPKYSHTQLVGKFGAFDD